MINCWGAFKAIAKEQDAWLMRYSTFPEPVPDLEKTSMLFDMADHFELLYKANFPYFA